MLEKTKSQILMVFEYDDYKNYLKDCLGTTGQQRGIRSRLAKHLNCQTSFVTQALRERGDFSIEHAIQISEFLNHTEDEKHYFMLLHQRDRAGSIQLKEYYSRQIEEIKEKRSEVKERIKVNGGLNEKDHQVYYSQWYYSAVHIAVAIQEYQSFESLLKRLSLDKRILTETLTFLSSKGLVEEKGGHYKIGKARIHLDKNSPMIFKHHTNWRLEGIKALESQNNDNLHYSSILAIAREDAQKIKQMLLKALEDIEPVVAPSPEEELYSLCMDLFKL